MFLLVDKPKGITSHDVVDKIRKITGERKVGHGGTLDPNATGLLIIAVGRDSTKKLSIFLNLDKEYEAEIVLGEERETDDAEGKVRKEEPMSRGTNEPDINEIKNVLKHYIGKQMQIPPAYSAKKIKGKPAYKLARRGADVKLKPKEVKIYSIELLSYKYPVLKMSSEVSSGTYIRSLARDIGRKLGVGAYLNNLRRTKIGDFLVKNSTVLDKLNSENWKSKSIDKYMLKKKIQNFG